MRIRTNILNKLRSVHSSILAGNEMSTGEVTLYYRPDRADYDRNDRAAVIAAAGAEVDELSEAVNAGIHFIAPAEVVHRGFMVIAAGDVIVDFSYKLDLDQDGSARQRDGLEFGILEKRYIIKEGGDAELLDGIETVVSGQLPYQTVVLTPKRA